MSRPRKAETIVRPGTRRICAQRLNNRRVFYGVSLKGWAEAFPYPITAQTLSRYERIGPPTLDRYLVASMALTNACMSRNGGIQLDIEATLKGMKC